MKEGPITTNEVVTLVLLVLVTILFVAMMNGCASKDRVPTQPLKAPLIAPRADTFRGQAVAEVRNGG